MRVCLFEDAGHSALEPLATTRPVFDLLCGLTSLREKQARFTGSRELGVLVRPELAPLYSTLHPKLAVNDLVWLRSGPILLINGRWLPPAKLSTPLPGPCVGLVG